MHFLCDFCGGTLAQITQKQSALRDLLQIKDGFVHGGKVTANNTSHTDRKIILHQKIIERARDSLTAAIDISAHRTDLQNGELPPLDVLIVPHPKEKVNLFFRRHTSKYPGYSIPVNAHPSVKIWVQLVRVCEIARFCSPLLTPGDLGRVLKHLSATHNLTL